MFKIKKMKAITDYSRDTDDELDDVGSEAVKKPRFTTVTTLQNRKRTLLMPTSFLVIIFFALC